MALTTRKVDAKSRVTLPERFANQRVVVDRVGDDEVRIKLSRAPKKRASLQTLLAGITDENLPDNLDFGAPVGEELL